MVDKTTALAWRCGATVQGICLGIALAAAIIEIVTLTTGAQVFKYQGF